MINRFLYKKKILKRKRFKNFSNNFNSCIVWGSKKKTECKLLGLEGLKIWAYEGVEKISFLCFVIALKMSFSRTREV